MFYTIICMDLQEICKMKGSGTIYCTLCMAIFRQKEKGVSHTEQLEL